MKLEIGKNCEFAPGSTAEEPQLRMTDTTPREFGPKGGISGSPMSEQCEPQVDTSYTGVIATLRAQLASAEQRIAALRPDAERYRWLRSRLWIRTMRSVAGSLRPALSTVVGRSFMDSVTVAPNEKRAAELDAAIDAAQTAATVDDV